MSSPRNSRCPRGSLPKCRPPLVHPIDPLCDLELFLGPLAVMVAVTLLSKLCHEVWRAGLNTEVCTEHGAESVEGHRGFEGVCSQSSAIRGLRCHLWPVGVFLYVQFSPRYRAAHSFGVASVEWMIVHCSC